MTTFSKVKNSLEVTFLLGGIISLTKKTDLKTPFSSIPAVSFYPDAVYRTLTYSGCFLCCLRLRLFSIKDVDARKVCIRGACAGNAYIGDVFACAGNACTECTCAGNISSAGGAYINSFDARSVGDVATVNDLQIHLQLS